MKKRVLPSVSSNIPSREGSVPPVRDTVLLDLLPRYADGWLVDCEIQQHSPNTISLRRTITNKLVWFCRQNDFPECGVTELRRFFIHLTNGHLQPGGRWGSAGDPVPANTMKKASPGTVKTYHRHVRTFFRWMVDEGLIDASPLEKRNGAPSVPVPEDRPDQIQPFTRQQVGALQEAAKRTASPERDLAILLLFLDTGVRATEMCSLTIGDLDMMNWYIRINEGKGGKARTLRFGKATKSALYKYLLQDKNPRRHDPASPLFISERTHRAGMALTRSGLQDLFGRFKGLADLSAVRCSPHTCRHTYAVEFLRAGGNVFALQELLGHTDIKQTQRYVRFVEADIENQSRRFSPVDQMKGPKLRRTY